MVTARWLSEYVEKTCDFLQGMVELRSMIFVITPPAVSMPILSGATSMRRMSRVASLPCPVRMAAWTDAP
jgi:hypothetical protein